MTAAARSPAGLRRAWHRIRRTTLAWRRPIAAVLMALAVLTAVRAATAPPEPAAPVVVATRDLAGGRPVATGDVALASLPAGAVPAGATADPTTLVGRTLAAPVRRGEVVTDVRVVEPGLLRGYPGLVATPVRVVDAGSVGLLRVGDRVDVLGTDPASGRSRVLTEGAPVVALPRGSRSDDGLAGGALVVLAVPRPTALDLAGSAAVDLLTVLLSE